MRFRLLKQLTALLLVAAIFAGFNYDMYMLLTRRLANNFSGVSQIKMIDVKKYLPFDAHSDLPQIESSFHLQTDLPVLDGAAALVPVYAAVINAVYPEGSVTYEGGAFSDDNLYGENFAADSVMQYRNTLRGYKAVVDGGADILFCAGPSAEQKQYAEEQGVTLRYVPIGKEAFVFFVNKNNPVTSLTTDELRSIYAGEITNWKALGGPNRPINPVTRIAGSGSQSMMDAFMKDTPYGKKSPFVLAGAAIGYSFRYYMDGIVGSDEVRMLELNGVSPTTENIRTGAYPLVTPFYAIYRENTKNKNVEPLIEWLLSPEGQALIEACGYVGIG